MGIIISVIFDVVSVVLMGIVFFALYVNGKLILIKFGLIEGNKPCDEDNEDNQNLSMKNKL
tara:strand:+ start:167 stop:349 length:183 start_codon:yes stop_codon:yes gene_type:complete